MAKVTLITHTTDPERLISAAAKLCYSPSSIEDIQGKISEEESHKFINMLMNIGHESPIEHVTFTFGIEGVSRAFLAQITRHRMASYSVQSQRYVKETSFSFVTPPEIAGVKEAEDEFLKTMEYCSEQYEKLTDILIKKYLVEMEADGLTGGALKRAAQKKAIEDARFVLPNACDTKMIVTMNARGLFNFFQHRLCNRAQWEIREVAKEMLKLVYDVAPTLFSKCGPACVGGKCSEGKMTCGKMDEVREEFRRIKGEI